MTDEEYKAYRIAVLKHSIKCRLFKINPKKYPAPGKAPYLISEMVSIEMERAFNREKVQNLFERDDWFFKSLKRYNR